MRLTIRKTEYPFGATPELKELVKEAHIDIMQVKKEAPREGKRFAYLAAKAASKKAGIEFAYNWNEFINLVEPGCVKKAAKLAKEMYPSKKEADKVRKVKEPKADNKDQAAKADSVKAEPKKEDQAAKADS